ncbi:MAG TPA: dethiobiotin synthetase [Jatrophihabitans sp.]|nr:dethiobiotin synthetase [Jatrophihabitans sp.]
MPPYVAVIGPADATGAEIAAAAEVGLLLGQGGAVVLTGGLGGVMAAATDAAAAAGAVTVALLPGRDRSDAPPSVSVAIPTGLGEMRNALLVRSADAVIAVGCSWGTLSEIALARRTGVPLVCLGGWTISDAGGAPVDLVRAADPEQAVAAALRAGRGR